MIGSTVISGDTCGMSIMYGDRDTGRMNLSALLPKPLRQRMITEVMASYALLAVLDIGLSAGVAAGGGYPLTPVLVGWAATGSLFVAGGFLISTDLIGVSNGLTESARSLAAGDFSTTFSTATTNSATSTTRSRN